MKLTDNQTIYVRSMNKALKVVAICSTDDEANDFCEKNVDTGVIAVFGELVFIANLYDRGVQIGA